MTAGALAGISAEVVACSRCPRLRAWCARVAQEKRAAYRGEEYWGLPVPSFGDPRARLLLIGLAPGAHGANRTGRMFTGDDSADFLTAALHRVGLADRPTSRRRDDGLRLDGVWVTAAAHCAPPANRPSPEELDRCRSFLARELRALPLLRVVVPLGGIAFAAAGDAFREAGWDWPRPRPRFAHGARVEPARGRPLVIASYHPSRQNTRTGRLTPGMLETVLRQARAAAEL